MLGEREIRENLREAGCGEGDIETIVTCFLEGDRQKMRKGIAACRKIRLEKLHEDERCIDRLDYLTYRLHRES